MADAVTIRKLVDMDTRSVHLLTSISAGDGESAVKKIDITDLKGYTSGGRLKINKVAFCINGGSVELLWEATSNVVALVLSGYNTFYFNDQFQSSLENNAGAGVTGSILLTTRNFTNASTYSILIETRKVGFTY